jgi:ADP-ribose pyrophosphatase
MTHGEAKVVWDCPWWRVEEQEFAGPNGERGLWYTARRPNPNTVHILGIGRDGMVPLIRQYRVPFGAEVWELPAGLCDIAGESMEDSARRELLEETGYACGRMEHLLRATVSPGLTDEVYNAFLALELEKAGEGGGTGSEQIEVVLIHFAELSDFLTSRIAAGEWADAKILAHIILAQRKLDALGIKV